jgi:hypothetical protein
LFVLFELWGFGFDKRIYWSFWGLILQVVDY